MIQLCQKILKSRRVSDALCIFGGYMHMNEFVLLLRGLRCTLIGSNPPLVHRHSLFLLHIGNELLKCYLNRL